MKSKALALATILLSTLAAGGVGECQEADLNPRPDETMERFEDRVIGVDALAASAEDETAATIAEQPSTPPAGGGFGSRVSDSLNDFLPLFNFAVDAIDTADDQKSVTVTFSPVPVGEFGEVNLTAKIFEPAPFEQLLEKIPEAARAAQKEAIAKRIDDYSDLLFSASYGLQWKTYANWSNAPRVLFGRNVELYEGLIHELMKSRWEKFWNAQPEQGAQFLSDCEEEIGRVVDPSGDPVAMSEVPALKVQEILQGSTECSWSRYMQEVERKKQGLANARPILLSEGVKQLAAMIDNQPQLILSLSTRDRDELVGRSEDSAKLQFEIGTRNFNTVLRHYDRNKSTLSPADALEEVAKRPYDRKDRVTIALTFTRLKAYSLPYAYVEKATDPATGNEVEFDRTADLTLDERDEWTGSATWSFGVRSQSFERDGVVVVPRFEGSIEYIDVEGDPNRQNRFVARASYLLPGPNGMTLPFTVTWADKSEFLGEQDHVFGAHLGLTFKMDTPAN